MKRILKGSLLAFAALPLALAACAAPDVPIGQTDNQSSPVTNCPPVMAPPVDFCEKGVEPVLAKNSNGCEEYSCPAVDGSACPPVMAPPIDFCGKGVDPVMSKDSNGCEQFSCPETDASACPPEPPVQACPSNYKAEETKDAMGCPFWHCVLVMCGKVTCGTGNYNCQTCHVRGNGAVMRSQWIVLLSMSFVELCL